MFMIQENLILLSLLSLLFPIKIIKIGPKLKKVKQFIMGVSPLFRDLIIMIRYAYGSLKSNNIELKRLANFA